MSIKINFLLIALLWILSHNRLHRHENDTGGYAPLHHKQEYVASTSMKLKFTGTASNLPELKISFSLGSTLISGMIKEKTIVYELPPFISTVSGRVNWELVNTKTRGNFTIIPHTQIAQMETYVGPPSIIANDKDYSMVVTLPLDSYDNVQEDGTAVSFNYHKENKSILHHKQVQHLIAYDYIASTKKTGNILLAASAGKKSSKEFTIDIYAGLPVSFTLSRKRNHNYADGNQLASFYTSVLKDEYDNVVNDGTLVTFYITTSEGAVLQTTGTTIKGVATGLMVHPEKRETWSIVAVVAGMATSDTIVMDFEPVFENYQIAINEEARTVTVGPFLSFMQQIIPDGLTVELTVLGKTISQSFEKQSFNGQVVFELHPDLIPRGMYTITVNAGGITRTLKNITL